MLLTNKYHIMKNKLLLSLILLFLHFTLISNISFSQWVPTTGPGGGDVQCFLSNGTDIYAGLYSNYSGGSAVYRSTNNGASWTGRGNIPSARALVISGTYMFAATVYSGVYLSTNNGANWFVANSGLSGQNVISFAVIGSNIFAGTSSNGVYISTNSGGSWANCGLTGQDISFVFANGTSLFAGTYFSGIYRSTNNGGNWTAINSGLTNTFTTCIAVSGTYLYVGAGGAVCVSTNNGNNWTQTSLNNIGSSIYAVASSGATVLAGTEEYGFFRSTNNGVNWTQISFNKWVNVISFSGTTAFVGSSDGYLSNGGVYRSTNSGLNFTSSGVNNQTIDALASVGSNIFAGNSSGVYLSSNNGDLWSCVDTGLVNKDVQCLASIGSNLFAGTYDGGVFLSSNNGLNWHSVNTGLISQNVYSLISSGSNLFAGTYGAGVFLSTNNGTSWTSANNGITSQNVYCFALSSSGILAGTEAGVFYSTNTGGSWTSIGLTNQYINSLTTSGMNIIAATNYSGLYRSTNNGGSWVNSGFPGYYVSTLITNGSLIFAGTGGNGTGYGIYMSTDFGGSWINRNQGFNFPPAVYALLIANNYIFAGTDTQSVWRRALPDIIGIKQISEIVPSKYSLSQNYPNPFNPTSIIRFQIPNSENGKLKTENGIVSLKVFDIIGKEVVTLVNEKLSPGVYEVTFDGGKLASGTYFYRLTTNGFSETKKMLMIK